MKNRENKEKETINENKKIKGLLRVTQGGLGFVETEESSKTIVQDDIFIDENFLNTGLHGDMVEVSLFPNTDGRPSGEVINITERKRDSFVGVIKEVAGKLSFIPQDSKMYLDINLKKEDLKNIDQKILVKIISWSKEPQGEVISILGPSGNNNVEMEAIALEQGFEATLHPKIEDEAKALKEKGISQKDIDERRDMRNITTFTIDPDDAKDFDDALSVERLPNGNFEIGIHIADVSHYVQPGSELDKEAQKRTTSVYLVDRTIPMLPEILSNDLCSLREKEEKLTFSAIFTITPQAEVIDQWFGRTIINSDKRFTYEEAQKNLDNKGGEFYEELETLNNLALKLRKERFNKGAVSLEQEEVKFILDETGKPVDIKKKVMGATNKLIEEFMLLANKKVAEYIANFHKVEGGFLYRIHDEPNPEKVKNLVSFLKTLGYHLKTKDGKVESKDINKLIESLAGKEERHTIQTVIIRSMSKAIYSTKNIGHFGLAFKHYAHFTSPIRRYPDVLVHRFLEKYIKGGNVPEKDWRFYEKMSLISSEREKEAQQASRASIKYKQAEYMSERIGQTFNGLITGITKWGIYVEEEKTKCEGMIRLKDLGNDYFIFDESNFRVMGSRSKKKFGLGDKLKIKVVNVSIENRLIDYQLA